MANWRTPPEVRKKRKGELRAQEELWDITSDDGSEAGGLPTRPGSAESSLDTSHRRKRRRVTEDADDGEAKRSLKIRLRSAQKSSIVENAVPSPPQVNVRKRRRILDVGDEEDSKGRSAKVQATAPRSPNIWLSRLRTRRLADDVGEREKAARPTETHKNSTRNTVYKTSATKNPRKETRRQRICDTDKLKEAEDRRNRPSKARVSTASVRAAARQAAQLSHALQSRRPAG